MASSRKRHGWKVPSHQQIKCLLMSQGVSSTAGFRISELVLAVPKKKNRKAFLDETEIIWKSVSQGLLVSQSVHASFLTCRFLSVFLYFSVQRKNTIKMGIWKVSVDRIGWLRRIRENRLWLFCQQAASLDVAQYSKEMFENRLFFLPKSPPDFREISSLICEHKDLQGNWKGRQLTWIVGHAFLCDMSLGSGAPCCRTLAGQSA